MHSFPIQYRQIQLRLYLVIHHIHAGAKKCSLLQMCCTLLIWDERFVGCNNCRIFFSITVYNILYLSNELQNLISRNFLWFLIIIYVRFNITNTLLLSLISSYLTFYYYTITLYYLSYLHFSFILNLLNNFLGGRGWNLLSFISRLFNVIIQEVTQQKCLWIDKF